MHNLSIKTMTSRDAPDPSVWRDGPDRPPGFRRDRRVGQLSRSSVGRSQKGGVSLQLAFDQEDPTSLYLQWECKRYDIAFIIIMHPDGIMRTLNI